jgi:transposase
MTQFIPFNRDQAFLPPPDAKDWLPEDDVAHFVVAAVERVPLGAFAVRPIPGGKAQYHPRLMLALLIYCYANGIFSSRRIERATYRNIGVRYVAANLHPDHDTIAAFRRVSRAAFEAAFLQVLLLPRKIHQGERAWCKPLNGRRIRLRTQNPAVSGHHARQHRRYAAPAGAVTGRRQADPRPLRRGLALLRWRPACAA